MIPVSDNQGYIVMGHLLRKPQSIITLKQNYGPLSPILLIIKVLFPFKVGMPRMSQGISPIALVTSAGNFVPWVILGSERGF